MSEALPIITIGLAILSVVASSISVAFAYITFKQNEKTHAYVDSIERYCTAFAEGMNDSNDAYQSLRDEEKFGGRTMEELADKMIRTDKHEERDVDTFIKDINSEKWLDEDTDIDEEDDEDEPFM